MANSNLNPSIETQENPVETVAHNRAATIGILCNYHDGYETRTLLTPEACGLLTSAGIGICMESGAGTDISFPDDTYAEYGVQIVSRQEALRAPVVLCYTALRAADIEQMTPSSALLCMMDQTLFDPKIIQTLIDCRITCGCFDNMYSSNDEPVFANIIDEIDGRAAIIYAEEALSYLGGGKGVLLAGVAGLNPCEVLLFGAGTDMIAAARAAAAIGARVTLMDNDISTLQVAHDILGNLADTVAIHPRVLFNHIKTADVIIQGSTTRPFEIPRNLISTMKENVYMIDMSETHPSVSVPRTVAMALSNALVNFFEEMAIKNNFNGMIATTPGVQSGIVTYEGHLVDKLIGSYLGLPSVDISVMLSAMN